MLSDIYFYRYDETRQVYQYVIIDKCLSSYEILVESIEGIPYEKSIDPLTNALIFLMIVDFYASKNRNVISNLYRYYLKLIEMGFNFDPGHVGATVKTMDKALKTSYYALYFMPLAKRFEALSLNFKSF